MVTCVTFSCLQASIWVPTLGFTLLFGSLIVKTWRIYYIFGQINAKSFNKAKFKVSVCLSGGIHKQWREIQVNLAQWKPTDSCACPWSAGMNVCEHTLIYTCMGMAVCVIYVYESLLPHILPSTYPLPSSPHLSLLFSPFLPLPLISSPFLCTPSVPYSPLSMQPPVDWMLLLVIAAMVAVDIVFFVIVTSIDSSRFYATEQRTAVGPRGHTAHN